MADKKDTFIVESYNLPSITDQSIKQVRKAITLLNSIVSDRSNQYKVTICTPNFESFIVEAYEKKHPIDPASFTFTADNFAGKISNNQEISGAVTLKIEPDDGDVITFLIRKA